MPRRWSSHYSLDNVFHLRVQPASAIVGSARDNWDDLQRYDGLNIITVLDGESHQSVSDGAWSAGDRLTVIGTRMSYAATPTTAASGSSRRAAQPSVATALLNRESGAAEVVVPPRSRFEARRRVPATCSTVASSCSPSSGRARTAAPRTPCCEAGDVLLVEGDWSSLDEITRDRDLLVVDAPELVRRQAVPMGARSREAVVVLVAHGRAARHRRRAGRHCDDAGRRRDDRAPGRVRPAGLPRHLVDHRAPRRRADPALHGDHRLGRRAEDRGPPRRRRWRRRTDRTAGRTVHRDRHVRPADQQHGDRARDDPDRRVRGRPARTSRPDRC